jgi:hypothetical protein
MIISYTICYQHLAYGTILFSLSFSLVRQSFYEPQLWINPKTLTENMGFNPKSGGKKKKKASISFDIYVFYLHNYFLQMCDQHLGIKWTFHGKEEEEE